MKSIHANVRVMRGFIYQVFMPNRPDRTPRKAIIKDAKKQLDIVMPEWESADLVIMHYDRNHYNTKNEHIEIWNEQ